MASSLAAASVRPTKPRPHRNSSLLFRLPIFSLHMKTWCISRGEMGSISSPIKRNRASSLQAMRNSRDIKNDGNENQDEEDKEDEEDPITSDALRAAIMKSKKVLAMQKDILQQIVERRKLISTMKDEIVNKEQAPSNDKNSMDQVPHESSNEYNKNYKNTNPYFHNHNVGVKLNTPPLVPGIYETITENNNQNSKNNSDNKLEEVYIEEQNKNEGPLAGDNLMNIVLVSAECAPWSKTGGLGDVAGALPKALARRGHRVMVVAPRYARYAEAHIIGERKRYTVAGQDMEVAYYHAYIDGVDFVFLDSPIFRHVEKDIYGGDRLDILKRMILLCKAAVEAPWYVPCGGVCYGDGNLVFIANDWHTALLPVYLKAYYRDKGFMIYARSILVIHNIAHQGRGPVDDFKLIDLPNEYMDMFKLYDPLGGDHCNIFSAGIKSADRVLTVSHGYAWELKTSEGGWGLHSIINDHDWKFQGIVNGIDTNDWNPKLDTHLNSDGYTNYSLETLKDGKTQCKSALQRELGLPVNENIPLIGFIGRLDHQKGVDLICDAMHWIVSQDVQLVMLGSGRPDLEDMLRKMENQHRDKVRSWVGFSVKMAHRITAGADILLMPSRFEPCGLNQLYAMAYGTVPVVHAVGGLKDTVEQYNPYKETGLGWTFDKAEANRMIDALGHCLNTYRNYKTSWDVLMRRGMMQDLSWDRAAKLYEDVLVAAKYQW